MADFRSWDENRLREFVLFAGQNPGHIGHEDLVIEAVKVYSSDPHSLQRFEQYKSSAGAYPSLGYPPVQSRAPPYGGPPAPSGSSAYPVPQYPTVDFTQAPPPAAASAYPPYAQPPAPAAPAGGAYPPVGPTGGAPSPYPAPGGASAPPFPAAGAPPGPANPYPSAGPPAAPQNPYPTPGAAPAHQSPYPAAGGAPAQHSPYPSPGGAPAAAPHSPYPPAGGGGFPSAPAAAGGSFAPPPQAQQPPPQQQQQHPARAHHHASTGRKKALLIGCNYPGTRAELRGCCTDVQHVEYLLKTRFGFQDITILRDDTGQRDIFPTRRNIMRHIDLLVQGCRPGDSLFFHFSGHGSQKRDYSGDERDGMNETLCPCDFETAGQIVDDELNKRLVNPLPKGVRLHALLDACHSGTGLDLPYITKMDKRSGHLGWKSEGRTRVYKGTAGGLAVQFGACKDSQTAADTASLSGGTHTGAATYLFIQSVEKLISQQQPLRYGAIISEMLKQIKAFQNGQHGRGVDDLIMGGLVGGLLGTVLGGGMSSMSGGGGGGGGKLGGLMSALLGGSVSGQTPQLSASEPFDLNMQMAL